MTVQVPDAREDLEVPGGGIPGILAGVPERAFVVALRNGFAWLRENPSAWDALLRHADDIERAAVKDVFGVGGKFENLRIVAGFPTAPTRIPQITVLVEEEALAEGGAFVGDEAFEEDDSLFGGQGGEMRGEIRDQMLTVTITAEQQDVCVYLYRAVDAVLLAHLDWFMRSADEGGAGLMRVEWRSGGPVIPDPREPSRLWGRQSKWVVTGLAGAALPIPPPKLRADVHLATGYNDPTAGIPGRVRVRS